MLVNKTKYEYIRALQNNKEYDPNRTKIVQKLLHDERLTEEEIKVINDCLAESYFYNGDEEAKKMYIKLNK